MAADEPGRAGEEYPHRGAQTIRDRRPLAVLGLVAIAGSARPAIEPPPTSFAFAIGNGDLAGGPEQVAERLGGFDLVVVDGELATADEVAALQAPAAPPCSPT